MQLHYYVVSSAFVLILVRKSFKEIFWIKIVSLTIEMVIIMLISDFPLCQFSSDLLFVRGVDISVEN